MIPNAYIIEWRNFTPWKSMDMVEQDMLISRAISDIYSNPDLRENLAFRGGTALHKLFLKTPLRYSEDIDLVQTQAGPIGPIFNSLRKTLKPWLGEPSRKTGPDIAVLTFRVPAETGSGQKLRLKIDINTREHLARTGYNRKSFSFSCRWHSASCKVLTFSPAEILGTKLRALYQRRKGRDLFDIWSGLDSSLAEPREIADIFRFYMGREGIRVTSSVFRANLKDKMENPDFISDLLPLIPMELHYDPVSAAELVNRTLLSELE